jgi:hypothetical protein
MLLLAHSAKPVMRQIRTALRAGVMGSLLCCELGQAGVTSRGATVRSGQLARTQPNTSRRIVDRDNS